MIDAPEIYVGTELKSGPWFIKKIGDGEIVIPRTSPLYLKFLEELTACKALDVYKKIFEELELAKKASAEYQQAVANFEQKKAEVQE